MGRNAQLRRDVAPDAVEQGFAVVEAAVECGDQIALSLESVFALGFNCRKRILDRFAVSGEDQIGPDRGDLLQRLEVCDQRSAAGRDDR